MNAVEIEQAISELATKVTFRLASFDNTHASQTTRAWRFRKSEMNRQIDEQEYYGERR